jgi:putative salt-induced outer membrane protein YdiY
MMRLSYRPLSHVTGEVKKLERGRLKYKTDDMGTIYIEWDNILEITSKDHFEVELNTGERHFGSLGPAAGKQRMEVIGEEETVALEHDSIVRIAPIEETFWGRIDGSLDLGFSFTQANDETQLSMNLEANYRARRRQESISLNSIFTSREAVEDTERNSLQFRHLGLLKKRRILWGLAQLQRNTELQLDLRSLVGGGLGRFFIQTNRTLLSLGGGLGVTWEDFSTVESRSSTELILALNYSIFTYDYPNTDISVALVVFPSLTESGRVRVEFDSSLRRELVKDFYFNLTLFDSFDNKNPVEGAEENDWGVVTSIGWSF